MLKINFYSYDSGNGKPLTITNCQETQEILILPNIQLKEHASILFAPNKHYILGHNDAEHNIYGTC